MQWVHYTKLFLFNKISSSQDSAMQLVAKRFSTAFYRFRILPSPLPLLICKSIVTGALSSVCCPGETVAMETKRSAVATRIYHFYHTYRLFLYFSIECFVVLSRQENQVV